MTSPRRTFLRRTGAALLAGATAGCLGNGQTTATDDPAGDPTATATATPAATETASPTPTDAPTAAGTETDTATATPADGGLPNAGYAEWLPAPAAFDRDHYGFVSVAPAALLDHESSLGDGATDNVRSDPGVPGVESYGDARAFHQIRPGVIVFETDVDREAAAEGLRSRGLSEADTRHGFAVFTGDDGAAALRESAIVTAPFYSEGDAARSVVEAIVDAKAGASQRYVDAVADCERLTAALGSAHLISGRTHPVDEGLDGAVAGGIAIEVGGSETTVRAPAVFPEGTVDEGALAAWAAESDVFYGQPVETSVEGRVATATATVQSADITQFRSGSPADPAPADETPQVSFDYEYEATGDGVGSLTITHDGGDSVPKAELFVRGTGFASVEGVDQTAAGQWQGTASGNDEAVVAGDRVTVGVASDYEITVVWETEDGDSSATLGEHDGPDA